MYSIIVQPYRNIYFSNNFWLNIIYFCHVVDYLMNV